MIKAFGYSILIVGLTIGLYFLPTLYIYWRDFLLHFDAGVSDHFLRLLLLLIGTAVPVVLIFIGFKWILKKS